MEPEGILRRYSLQEIGQYPVQADPGYPEYVAIPRQMSYPSSPERMLKMRHVSVPMGLPPHIQQEMIANHANHGSEKVRRYSLQENKKHVSFSHNSVPQEPKQESRNVSYPNGPGTQKQRRYSVCAVPQQQKPSQQKKAGSSTVAIDNKIEQAMDLVKSHLMFAVREEVDDLKIQIAELIERNNQLEYENSILRAAATPETLAKLAQPRQQPPSSSS